LQETRFLKLCLHPEKLSLWCTMRNFMIACFAADSLLLIALLAAHLFQPNWPHPLIAYSALAIGFAGASHGAATIPIFQPVMRRFRSNELVWIVGLSNLVAIADLLRLIWSGSEALMPFI
jgi:hypothetical protein